MRPILQFQRETLELILGQVSHLIEETGAQGLGPEHQASWLGQVVR